MPAGLGLTGRNIVVIGGHAGIGLDVPRALSRAGASVTVGARHPDRAGLGDGTSISGAVTVTEPSPNEPL